MAIVKKLITGFQNYPRHVRAQCFQKRIREFCAPRGCVSITFDDFPQSTFNNTFEMLRDKGIKSTYYICAGLLGRETPVGKIINRECLKKIIENDNEIACHTFGHVDAWLAKSTDYSLSIKENSSVINDIFPNMTLKNFAYPKGSVTPAAKKEIEKYFVTARGIYWGINSGFVDANLLRACELFSGTVDFKKISSILRHNQEQKGWLIFYTHDVQCAPSRFGCTPEYFTKTIEAILASGAEIGTIETISQKYLR